MKTLNGNLFCAIDCETTGLDPEVHDIWEVAIIPLDMNLEIDKSRPIFDLVIRPDNLDDITPHGVKREYVEEHGVTSEHSCRLFCTWFEKLGLGDRRVCPVAHNWKFDYLFFRRWLGHSGVEDFFDGRARDTMTLAICLNDAHEFTGLKIPYPSVSLGALCKYFDVPLENAHRAIEDANATRQLYKKLLGRVGHWL